MAGSMPVVRVPRSRSVKYTVAAAKLGAAQATLFIASPVKDKGEIGVRVVVTRERAALLVKGKVQIQIIRRPVLFGYAEKGLWGESGKWLT